MLEHVPAWLGHMIRDRRAGHGKLVAAYPEIRLGADTIDLSSPAFPAGGRLPVRFTADGEGVSPPLVWTDVPEGTISLALIVEDPDAPASQPLVHAIVWDMPPDEKHISEGAIAPDGDGGPDGDVGRNSFLREGWLPPDPPTGHGEHDYVFPALRSVGASGSVRQSGTRRLGRGHRRKGAGCRSAHRHVLARRAR